MLTQMNRDVDEDSIITSSRRRSLPKRAIDSLRGRRPRSILAFFGHHVDEDENQRHLAWQQNNNFDSYPLSETGSNQKAFSPQIRKSFFSSLRDGASNARPSMSELRPRVSFASRPSSTTVTGSLRHIRDRVKRSISRMDEFGVQCQSSPIPIPKSPHKPASTTTRFPGSSALRQSKSFQHFFNERMSTEGRHESSPRSASSFDHESSEAIARRIATPLPGANQEMSGIHSVSQRPTRIRDDVPDPLCAGMLPLDEGEPSQTWELPGYRDSERSICNGAHVNSSHPQYEDPFIDLPTLKPLTYDVHHGSLKDKENARHQLKMREKTREDNRDSKEDKNEVLPDHPTDESDNVSKETLKSTRTPKSSATSIACGMPKQTIRKVIRESPNSSTSNLSPHPSPAHRCTASSRYASGTNHEHEQHRISSNGTEDPQLIGSNLWYALQLDEPGVTDPADQHQQRIVSDSTAASSNSMHDLQGFHLNPIHRNILRQDQPEVQYPGSHPYQQERAKRYLDLHPVEKAHQRVRQEYSFADFNGDTYQVTEVYRGGFWIGANYDKLRGPRRFRQQDTKTDARLDWFRESSSSGDESAASNRSMARVDSILGTDDMTRAMGYDDDREKSRQELPALHRCPGRGHGAHHHSPPSPSID